MLMMMLVPSGRTHSPNRIRVFVRRVVPSSTGRVRCTSQIVACRSSPSAGIGFVGQPLAQVRVPAQPLQRPGQRRRGGLVTGTQQRQQLVGDVLVGDRLAVFVAGLQQQCQHVFTLFDGRVGAGLGDQRGDDGVEPAPLLHVAPPRAPRPEVRAHDRWADHEQRAERHHRRHGLPKFLQRSTFGAEYGAQDHPDGDPQHRLQRFELPALGPGRDLALDLFFDDAVVAAHPLAVERRRQQFAAIAVLVAGEAERRSRPERSTDRPVPRRRTLDQLGAGAEQLLGQRRVVDHHRVVVVGQVDAHDVAAVALGRCCRTWRGSAPGTGQSGSASESGDRAATAPARSSPLPCLPFQLLDVVRATRRAHRGLESDSQYRLTVGPHEFAAPRNDPCRCRTCRH